MASLSISTFDRLDAVELQKYVEPLIVNDGLDVTHEQYLHLFEALHEYDQYHLVYALEICARYDLSSIAPLLPEFLRHVEGSVVCAAINILESLPAECLSEGLLQQLETIVVESRWTQVVKSLQDKLRIRLRTNRCT